MTWTLPQLLEHVEEWQGETVLAASTARFTEARHYNLGASDSYTVVACHLKQMIEGDKKMIAREKK